MSSFKKRQKTLKRAHKERSQLHSRQHLGLLEKHKDYVLRARDYEKKKTQLKQMHEKARNRNPDEFYYKMIKTRLKGGKHVVPQDAEKFGPEELQLMKTQDEKYVRMKLASETNKVERLKSCLHLTKQHHRTPHSHIIFVDSPEEVATVASELEDRVEARPKRVGVAMVKEEEGESEGVSLYKELQQRSQRCKELQRVCSRMKTQRDLMGKGHCVKIKGDGKSQPPTYKWKKERQK